MWTFGVLLFLLYVDSSSTIECICPDGRANQGDYYWRDYVGAIPKDAVEGGFSLTGNKTYVGQMASYIHKGIFPVNIVPGVLGGTGSIAGRTHEDTHVKILCSGRSTEFVWKNIDVDNLHLLTDYYLVVGGVETKAVTHIGRANYEGQVQIGRIYTKDYNEKGLWLYNKEGREVNFKTFEILILPRN